MNCNSRIRSSNFVSVLDAVLKPGTSHQGGVSLPYFTVSSPSVTSFRLRNSIVVLPRESFVTVSSICR